VLGLRTEAKIASPAAVIARKQRRPPDERGGITSTETVATRVVAIVIAARRISPRWVGDTIAVVIIVVPRRRRGRDCGCQQFLPGPPVLSTRNPGNADLG